MNDYEDRRAVAQARVDAAMRRRLEIAAEERAWRVNTIADLPRWAAAYYPTCAEQPPDFYALRLTNEQIAELFARMPSRQAHLALVDQPAIRRRFTDKALAQAVRAAWRRHEKPQLVLSI